MKNKLQTLLFFLIIISMIFGLFRSAYNFSKIISDKNTYIYKSKIDVEKRFFGDRVELASYLLSSTKKTVYLVNLDPLTFYYLRYRLYPNRVFRNNDKIYGSPITPKVFDYYVFHNLQDSEKYLKILQVDYTQVNRIGMFFTYKRK